MLKKKKYKIKFKVNKENIIEPKFKLDEIVYAIENDEIKKARIISITVTNDGKIIYSARLYPSCYIIREFYEGIEKIYNTLEEAKENLLKKVAERIDKSYTV